MGFMIRTLGRHFKETLKSLSRNAWMTFASVSAVTVTLILVGTFLVIMMNLNNFASKVEEDVEIRVLVDVTSTPEEQKQLRTKIDNLSGIKTAKLSPKEKELDNLISSMGEQGKSYQLFEQNNPLNDVIVIKTEDPRETPQIAKKIEGFTGAYKVLYGKEEVEKLFNFVEISRNIGIGLIIGLVFTAMFLISNTIKITIFARRHEIEIMKLVGATNWFIRWPFFLEGLMLGVMGSIIPIVLVMATYNYLYTWVEPKVAGSFVQLLPFSPFVFQVSAILILIGGLIGVWGSLMSVRKFLRV